MFSRSFVNTGRLIHVKYEIFTVIFTASYFRGRMFFFKAKNKENRVISMIICDKVFKSGLSKFCGIQPLKGYGLLKETLSL